MIKIILLFLSVILIRLMRLYHLLTDAQKYVDFWHIWVVDWKIHTGFRIVKYSLIILAIVGGGYWLKFKNVECEQFEIANRKIECQAVK